MHEYIIQLAPEPIREHDFITAGDFEYSDFNDFAAYVLDVNESGYTAALEELERLVSHIGHVNRRDRFIQFSLANVVTELNEWTRLMLSSGSVGPRRLSEDLKYYEGSRLMFWYLGEFVPSAFLIEDIARSYVPTALYIGGILDYKIY